MDGAPRKVLCTQCLTHSCVCSLRLAGLGGHAASVLGDINLTFIAAQPPAHREDRESPCDRWRQTGNFEVVFWSSVTNFVIIVRRAFLPWADARRPVPFQRGLRMIDRRPQRKSTAPRRDLRTERLTFVLLTEMIISL
jgi:hypothetical protein